MTTLRVVAYAINGRGMGHLVRQLAILRWARRLAAVAGVRIEPWLLTSSEADTLARREGIPALKIPSKAAMRDAGLEPARYLAVARAWVVNTLATLQPDLLLVDTFPGGSFGELVAGLEMAKKRALVAREVRPELTDDPAWRALLPLYDRVIVPGEGGVDPTRRSGAVTTRGPVLLRERAELLPRAAARAALGIPDGAKAVWISAGGGGDGGAGSVLPRLAREAVAAGWHAVVAAGPLYTGPEVRGPALTWLDRYAAVELLPGADGAISAGGYNSLHELWMAGVPAVFVPQPKLADDQAARVARAVKAGWALAPARLDDVVPALASLPSAAAFDTSPLPPGGAIDAAAAALSLVLDPADVDTARAAWSPDTLAALAGATLEPDLAVLLLRLLSPEPPSAVAHRRAILAAAGHPEERAGKSSAAPVAAFLALCAAHELPPAVAVPLLQHLSRRFPAARPPELAAALHRLVPRWARWGDWMGVVSFVRALPTQREYPLAVFVDDLARWDTAFADPYEALRTLNRASADRSRPLAEVLRQPVGHEP